MMYLMDKKDRIRALDKIKNNKAHIEIFNVPLEYKGRAEKFDVYRIPINLLVYNKDNTRIAADIKTFENSRYVLDSEKEADSKTIEDIIWKKDEKRNKKTTESLIQNGQQVYGIVTSDGTIVAGNRRFTLLRRIFEKRNDLKGPFVEASEYFNAVILNDTANKKDLLKLETYYQMGVDNKVDYEPIEIYISCAEQIKLGISEKVIAINFSTTVLKIKTRLEIFKIMERYLKWAHYDGLYLMLEGREDQFINYEAFVRKAAKGNTVGWAYDRLDIKDLEFVCFEYIKSRYEGKAFRKIFDVFSHKKSWDWFLKIHRGIKQTEESVKSIKERVSSENLINSLKSRDVDYRISVIEEFSNNLNASTGIATNIDNRREPLKLLQKAFDSIDEIKPSTLLNVTSISTVKKLINLIEIKLEEFNKIIKEK